MTHRRWPKLAGISAPRVASALLVGVLFGGGSDRDGKSADGIQPPFRIEKLSSAHLPNALRIHPKVICGGQPDGAAAFRELQALGVKTIISVDGMPPDVAAAAQFNLRYVHLPHGYDGISEQIAQELAKAVRDLNGPIYLHCHHGKHRGPTAAAVACVGSGLLRPENALVVLRTAGTSPNYRGLYQAAESIRPFDAALLDALKVKFRPTAPVPKLAESMVALDQAYDHLRELERNQWKPSPTHPDLDPQHETLLLSEHFAEILRTIEIKRRPQRLQHLMKEALAATRALETAIQSRDGTDPRRPDPKRIATTFARVTQSCSSCHIEFRDVPLQEKRRGNVPPSESR